MALGSQVHQSLRPELPNRPLHRFAVANVGMEEGIVPAASDVLKRVKIPGVG